MNGSVVLASSVDASRAGSDGLPGRRVAAGAVFETAPASSVAKTCAPESSCAGIGLARVTVNVTLARSYPLIVPRLQARCWPLTSGWGETVAMVTPGASPVVRSTPVSGLACSLNTVYVSVTWLFLTSPTKYEGEGVVVIEASCG